MVYKRPAKVRPLIIGHKETIEEVVAEIESVREKSEEERKIWAELKAYLERKSEENKVRWERDFWREKYFQLKGNK